MPVDGEAGGGKTELLHNFFFQLSKGRVVFRNLHHTLVVKVTYHSDLH